MAISDALAAYSSTAEMNTAISDAIDSLNLSQYQNATDVQFLIDQALLPYWDQTEISSFVAGELANYATNASVSSNIGSALSSYDNSSQVDSKIVTALLDFYTWAETDQAIADAMSGSVDLSPTWPTSCWPTTPALPGQLAHSHLHPILELAHANGDRRRRLRRRLPDPSGRRPALLRPGSRRGVGPNLQLGARAVCAPHHLEPAAGSAALQRRHPR